MPPQIILVAQLSVVHAEGGVVTWRYSAYTLSQVFPPTSFSFLKSVDFAQMEDGYPVCAAAMFNEVRIARATRIVETFIGKIAFLPYDFHTTLYNIVP